VEGRKIADEETPRPLEATEGYGGPRGIVRLPAARYIYSDSEDIMTTHVRYAEFSKNPAKCVDEAGGGPLLIDDKDLIVLSAQKYEGLLETLRLLRGDNRRELLEAIAEADADKFVERE
jgi:PHD/YefM family antitoxin component YafN of YafNO toxin-antitoxin module